MASYKDSNGNEVELPTLTVGMLESMAKAKEVSGIREKAEAMFSVLSKIFSNDYLMAELGSLNIEDMDAVELTNLFQGVDSAYGRAMRREQTKAINEELTEAQELLAKSKKMVDDAQFMTAINSNKVNAKANVLRN